jgi:hypothetical protein
LQDAVAVIDMDTLNFVHVCRWSEHGGPLASAGTCTLSTRSLADGSIDVACLVASPFAREAQVLHLSLPSAADTDVAASMAFVGPGRTAADSACDIPVLSLQAKTPLPLDSPLRAMFEPRAAPAGAKVGGTGANVDGTSTQKHIVVRTWYLPRLGCPNRRFLFFTRRRGAEGEAAPCQLALGLAVCRGCQLHDDQVCHVSCHVSQSSLSQCAR